MLPAFSRDPRAATMPLQDQDLRPAHVASSTSTQHQAPAIFCLFFAQVISEELVLTETQSTLMSTLGNVILYCII